jgi:hypothetical protein
MARRIEHHQVPVGVSLPCSLHRTEHNRSLGYLIEVGDIEIGDMEVTVHLLWHGMVGHVACGRPLTF